MSATSVMIKIDALDAAMREQKIVCDELAARDAPVQEKYPQLLLWSRLCADYAKAWKEAYKSLEQRVEQVEESLAVERPVRMRAFEMVHVELSRLETRLNDRDELLATLPTIATLEAEREALIRELAEPRRQATKSCQSIQLNARKACLSILPDASCTDVPKR